MISLIIHGCNGKMGRVVADLAGKDPDIKVAAGIDKYSDSGSGPFPVYNSFAAVKERADVIIDFSSPAALPELLEYASDSKTPLVIATTGHSPQDIELIEEKSKTVPIFRSANMSLGVNLMYELVQRAASVFGDRFDIEIIEKHHNQKLDSPSGTAFALADAINETFLNSKHYVYGRHSKNDKRAKNEIGIHAVRGGTIAGEHTVIFAGMDEVLEITHSAHSRQIFALGALAAAKYISAKAPGLYNMKDVLLDQNAVTSIYTDNDQAMITLNHLPAAPSCIAGIFSALADGEINIDMISQTAPVNGLYNVSFTLLKTDVEKAVCAANEYKKSYPDVHMDVFEDITKLTVEGPGMERQSGVAAKIFELMAKQNIQLKMVTTSETKISCIIDHSDEKQAVEAVIDEFKL